jgi:hypothetical protein
MVAIFDDKFLIVGNLAVGDEMNELGWSFTFLQVNLRKFFTNRNNKNFQHPTALRLTISLHHAKSEVLDSLLGDLKKCCEKILTEPGYEYPSKTVRNKGHLFNFVAFLECDLRNFCRLH